MRKDGFSLTELIAVIVVIGVILTIVIPVTQNIMKNNEEEKYTFYVQAVEKAVYAYADIEATSSGTTQSINLNELISKGYLKKFEINIPDKVIEFKKSSNGKVEVYEIILNFGTKSCTKDSCS